MDECDWPICTCDAANVFKELKAENERLKEENRWIPVSEGLPENISDVWVLLYAKATDSLSPGMGFYGELEGWELYGNGLLTDVAYWKPIILPNQALKGE